MSNIWMRADAGRMRKALEAEKKNAAVTRAVLAGQAKSIAMPEESGVDLSQIEWPTVPYYGFEHGKHTSELAYHIATDPSFALSADDLTVLKTAALLHDLGRTRPWDVEDPYHARRSADLADEVMKKTRWWAAPELRERVCRLIVEHSLDAKHKPSDPLLIALHDAECFEAVRFQREGQPGMQRMVKRRLECITQWALNETHHARYRDRHR